ncbi:MAG: hypothetical protein HFG62_14530 [Lachnospiraceae bacterium]|nr:hypothetical protein [Lachnospiraceae bacterium]
MNLVKEAQESRKKILLSALAATISVIAATPLFVISSAMLLKSWMRGLLIFSASIVMALGIGAACVLDREAGAFQCPACRTRFVPSMKDYLMGPHTLTRRRLKCPNCGERSYCKKVLTKSAAPQ